MSWTEITALFFGGLLAGGELVVRFGVRGPLARLGQQAHIEMRQELIRTLRVLVPILFALALLSSIAVTIAAPSLLRLGSLVLLLTFFAVTLVGTVPINKAVGGWSPAHPPTGWQDTIRRWERLDDWRTVLATGAFVLALLGAAGRRMN